jgi:hypothetical protein
MVNTNQNYGNGGLVWRSFGQPPYEIGCNGVFMWQIFSLLPSVTDNIFYSMEFSSKLWL